MKLNLEYFSQRYTRDAKTDCWNWNLSKTPYGYGYIVYRENNKKKHIYSHRLSWILFKGEIPKDMCVCHHCDNPPCVNPDHLFLGTAKNNREDSVMKNRSLKGIHPNTKITFHLARLIKIMAQKGYSISDIANKLNISKSIAHNVTYGITWKWVTILQ